MDNSDEPENLLDGKIVFQKNKDRTFNKTKVICTLCGKTLSFHSSNTSLKYHRNAKHALVGEGRSSAMRQTSFTRRTHWAKEAVSFTVIECEQVSLPHQLAKERLAKRTLRGIRLCHGVVNGCLTKNIKNVNHPIKRMAKKLK